MSACTHCKPVEQCTCCRIWEESGLELDEELCSLMIEDVIHHEAVVRESTAEALAACVATHSDHIEAVLQQLIAVYQEKLFVCLDIR